MITASFRRESVVYGEGYESFEVRGHAGFDVAGHDIVCAGVSVLAQSAVIGLSDVIKCNPQTHVDDGYLCCCIDPHKMNHEKWQDAQIILLTTFESLKDISEQYPDRIDLRIVD